MRKSKAKFTISLYVLVEPIGSDTGLLKAQTALLEQMGAIRYYKTRFILFVLSDTMLLMSCNSAEIGPTPHAEMPDTASVHRFLEGRLWH